MPPLLGDVQRRLAVAIRLVHRRARILYAYWLLLRVLCAVRATRQNGRKQVPFSHLCSFGGHYYYRLAAMALLLIWRRVVPRSLGALLPRRCHLPQLLVH
jgi:hypothetical protein